MAHSGATVWSTLLQIRRFDLSTMEPSFWALTAEGDVVNRKVGPLPGTGNIALEPTSRSVYRDSLGAAQRER